MPHRRWVVESLSICCSELIYRVFFLPGVACDRLCASNLRYREEARFQMQRNSSKWGICRRADPVSYLLTHLKAQLRRSARNRNAVVPFLLNAQLLPGLQKLERSYWKLGLESRHNYGIQFLEVIFINHIHKYRQQL